MVITRRPIWLAWPKVRGIDYTIKHRWRTGDSRRFTVVVDWEEDADMNHRSARPSPTTRRLEPIGDVLASNEGWGIFELHWPLVVFGAVLEQGVQTDMKCVLPPQTSRWHDSSSNDGMNCPSATTWRPTSRPSDAGRWPTARTNKLHVLRLLGPARCIIRLRCIAARSVWMEARSWRMELPRTRSPTEREPGRPGSVRGAGRRLLPAGGGRHALPRRRDGDTS